MYRSIENHRYSALYTAFMSMDQSIPTDMKIEVAISEATKEQIIEHIELVKSTTGRDVVLVGTRPAIQRLQNTITYDMFSGAMKDEKYHNGILGLWEGYECLALSRVNKAGTRDSVFTEEDNKKIYIMPIDPDNKPIKRVNEGDVMYTEAGMDGSVMDMTATVDIRYKEGVAVVINELFGELIALI